MTRTVLGTFGLLCVSCSPVAAPLFGPAQQLASGDEPVFATVADINGDQRPDLLVANAGSNSISVFFGSGEGLRPAADIPAGPEPDSIATGDFDHDDDIDIAIANHNTDLITVLLNDGKGEFSPAPGSPIKVEVDPHPHIVVTFDADQDDHLDLLIDDRNGNGYRLLRGQGDGRFVADPAPIDAGGDPYLGVALADLNDDGRQDLVAPLTRRIGIVLSANDGFRPPAFLPGGAFGVGLAQIVGDEAPDLIRGPETGPVEVWRGTGGGGFEPAWEMSVPRGAKRIATGDINGDGHTDFALQNFSSPGILIALASQAGIETSWITAGENPWGLAISDLNGDGKDDLVSVDNANNEVYVFLARDGDHGAVPEP